MSKLLIYVGENQKFDLEATIKAISKIEGVLNIRRGKFIGAIFECNYSYVGRTTVVRISEDLETITVEGMGEEATNFAVNLQKYLDQLLAVIDMDYSFNFQLSNFNSGRDLLDAINGV